MNARTIITTTKIASPTLTIDELASQAHVGVRTLYRYIETSPIPIWLWQAITKWYQESGPLRPAPIDNAFRYYMAKAYKQATPANPFAGEIKRGRPKGFTDNEDDDPKGGGKKWTGTKKHEKPEPASAANGTRDTKTPSVALLQSESNGEPISSGSKDKENQEKTSAQDLSLKSKDQERNSSEFIAQIPQQTAGASSGKTLAGLSNPLTPPTLEERSKTPDTTGLKYPTDSDAEGGLAHVGENPLSPRVFSHEEKTPIPSSRPWKTGLLSDVNYAVRALRQIAALDPVPQKLLGEFKADCALQQWALRWKESCREQKAYRLLAAKANIQLRKRPRNEVVVSREQNILAVIGPAISWLRQNSTHSKGAHDTRSFGFRRQQIEEVLALPNVARALANPDTGELPSISMIERVLREAGWKVDPRSEPENFVAQTIGWRPRFAGDVILADWTGLPFQVAGAVLETVHASAKKKERRFKKFGAHLAVDAATNYTWMDQTYGDNEFATWPRFLEWLLFEGLGYRPNWLVMDRVSGVVTSLLNGSPDDKTPNVMAEVLAWVAAGVRLHIHTPERANAKGHVEVAAKLIKHRELNQLTVRKCLSKHMQGTLVKPRDLVSHSDALRLCREMAVNVNKRPLSRDGVRLGERNELWHDAQDVAIREERALADTARHEWREIVSRAKLVWVAGSTAFLRMGGKKHHAELEGFEEAGICSNSDATAWIVPPLPGVDVDPEQYRVCLIEDRKGLPKFHSLTARIAKKDRFAFDESRPYLGEGYHAKPQTSADATKKSIDFAASAYAKSVVARQATTDEEDVEVQAV